MLFNSPEFIALFLPITLMGFYLLGNYAEARLTWLLAASAVFYGYWDIRFLPLLAGSIVFNWWLAKYLPHYRRSRLILLGVGFNLLLIGIFKYFNFFAENLYALTGSSFEPIDLVLPLGISFFTFQQISYLLDRQREKAPTYPLLHYALYVMFFPQLIAGPIVRHDEIIPKYQNSPFRPAVYQLFSQGVVLFCVGLLKKTLIADRLALTATPLFEAASDGRVLTLAEGWVASSSYSMQLYFDFSGYSDMAIGLGMMFGMRIPFNFNAPYVATSIRDFWRRWHISLSRFLRDYLYIPLGGNRRGTARMVSALFITMLLGGLWHGAGWTFVLWGMLHGLALIVNHLWTVSKWTLPRSIAWLLTLLFLFPTWVIFRADSLASAGTILASMIGLNGLSMALPISHNWGFSVLAFILAVAGPTSQKLALTTLRPRRIWAVTTAGLLIYLTLNLAGDGYTEFLYFQF
ncbi:MAG: MBOAT family protein [Candidatus Competibacteraceae bacterium]|jgi:D-alanyl-lipoteichoic acid acyltransferase DltB (MBOAT superfamily)|nr:MBOAT family protein [Candidatus Competibacteraceae bacterium]